MLKIEWQKQVLPFNFEAEPLLVIDPQFQVQYLNQKARKHYRYFDPLPVPCYQLTHGLSRPCFEEEVECPLRRVLEQKQSVTCVHRHKSPEKILYEKILATPLTAPSGEVLGMVEIVVDVSEYVEEEIRAREMAESLLELFDISYTGTLIVDQSGQIVWVNQSFQELFGLRKGDLLGQPLSQMVSALSPLLENGDQIQKRILESYEQGQYLEGLELHVLPQKGRQERWVEYSSQPIYTGLYKGGRLEHFVDITLRKDLEQKFLQAQRYESIAQMTTGIAHDFNNLLMTIRGFAELLVLKGVVKEAQNLRYLNNIVSCCEKGSEVIKKLLTFARKRPIKLEKVDLTRVVKDSIPLIKVTLGTQIKTYFELPSYPLWVWAHPVELEQMLLNLTTNARDAMPEGGEFRLRVQENGRQVWLEVEDTGVGIPPEILPRIFEPFFTTKKDLGSGLGLAVVYGIVKAFGGDIQVQSTPNQGTQFRIAFPLLRP